LGQHNKRGRALIINNDKSDLAIKDGQKLKELFEWLNFSVESLKDLTAQV
jgi:hypothetical protein